MKGFGIGYPAFLQSEFPKGGEDALFHLIPVPMERSVSYGGGTARGPSAILQASSQLEVYDGYGIPGEQGIRTLPPISCRGPVEGIFQRTAAAVEQILELGKIPILIGGEHSVTNGVFPALKNRSQKTGRPVGIVQIDAHGDLRDRYEGSLYSHACVMRRALDWGFPLFQLGVRSICPEEVELRRERDIPFQDAKELCSTVAIHTVQIPEGFPEEVYLTIDVDGLDPSVFPGTGTPEPGGLGWYQTLNLIDSLASQRKIIAFDLVELVPQKGTSVNEFSAARLIYQIMGILIRSSNRA